MHRGDLTNAEWERVAPLLPSAGRRPGRDTDDRTLINGMLYQARTGVRWRELPDRFGCWVTIYRRHRHWAATGTWQALAIALQTGGENAGRILGDDPVSIGAARMHLRASPANRTTPTPFALQIKDVAVLASLQALLGHTVQPRIY
ncbi:Transposase [Nonomuraea solani]|uniref:Transposase n=1 Tax=Nonomuraea solani TaxID=1144553 RepID=A0A1H6EBM6_9ACTN|nr:transposase [Nonomuraea solani]SEG94681.1 Transposase [Nonomuraea solani]